jgi:chromosome segregation ATPase
MPDSGVPRPTFKWEWNINTLAVVCGFVGGFMAWGYTLAELRTGREQNARNIESLNTQFGAMEARMTLLERSDAKMDQLDYRVAQNEKAIENVDIRMNRLAESYANRFADINTQLSAISTQIALVNQTAQEIKATQSSAPK